MNQKFHLTDTDDVIEHFLYCGNRTSHNWSNSEYLRSYKLYDLEKKMQECV